MFLKGKYHNETIPTDSDTHIRKYETSFLIVKRWYHIVNKWDCIHWLLNFVFPNLPLRDIMTNFVILVFWNYIPDDYEEIGHFDDKVMDGI